MFSDSFIRRNFLSIILAIISVTFTITVSAESEESRPTQKLTFADKAAVLAERTVLAKKQSELKNSLFGGAGDGTFSSTIESATGTFSQIFPALRARKIRSFVSNPFGRKRK